MLIQEIGIIPLVPSEIFNNLKPGNPPAEKKQISPMILI